MKYAPMTAKAARTLADRSADSCGVNKDDNWAIYGPDFLQDAQAMLEACGAPELLEALQDLLNAENTYPYGGMSESEIAAIQKARAAIAKAIGESE